MPLTISTSVNPASGPILDTPGRIAILAQGQGISAPAGQTIVGITIPAIRSDQTALQYETRNRDSEFRFNTGTLRLSLRQEIHLSSDLSSCAQTVWLSHEQKHVRDNEGIMTRMDAELRRDTQFSDILLNPTWRPRSQFQTTQHTIQTRVGEIFRRLTVAAVQALDTAQEYANTDALVQQRCTGSSGD